MIAPVVGSGPCPAWMARVPNPSLMTGIVHPGPGPGPGADKSIRARLDQVELGEHDELAGAAVHEDGGLAAGQH